LGRFWAVVVNFPEVYNFLAAWASPPFAMIEFGLFCESGSIYFLFWSNSIFLCSDADSMGYLTCLELFLIHFLHSFVVTRFWIRW
jgi:hypothetical protein